MVKVPLGLDMDSEVGVDAQVVAILSYVNFFEIGRLICETGNGGVTSGSKQDLNCWSAL